MKFIDLYAGIGGFRYALESFGFKCVFSSEIEKHAIDTYARNFNESPDFDMNSLVEMDKKSINKLIPDHDILTAGFPCQPFSHGGNKKGFEDTRGTQFFNVIKVINVKKPRFILLENVRNISTHDKGNTFKVILEKLAEEGYHIKKEPLILSPEQFGIPQRRKRTFFFAERNAAPFKFEVPTSPVKKNPFEKIKISDEIRIELDLMNAIEQWQIFVNMFEKDVVIPIIWLDYMITKEWDEEWPKSKKIHVQKMRLFYNKHKSIINDWIKKSNVMQWRRMKLRKLEYVSNSEPTRDFKKKIITLRQSGIRVSKPDIFPTLVAAAEIPMFYDKSIDKYRKMTTREMANLQSFPKKFKPHSNPLIAAKHFGNSVNITIIKEIIKQGVK